VSVAPRDGTTGAELARGLVVATHRRHYAVELGNGRMLDCVLKGRATVLACGDQVDVDRMASGNVIVRVAPRETLLYRSDAFRQKLIAANVTQVAGVVAADVPVDERLLNRWIVAAETQRCRFLLIVNKADLPGAEAFAARFDQYRDLGYPVVHVSARHDVAPLRPWLQGQRTVVIGQSGMGKSTLVNALVPQALAMEGAISDALRSGRHTTTSTTLYKLPDDDGWVVDSPGMKVFGLAHCDADTIVRAFVELRDLVEHCRFRNCRHAGEPGCAVAHAIETGRVNGERVALLHALIREANRAHEPNAPSARR